MRENDAKLFIFLHFNWLWWPGNGSNHIVMYYKLVRNNIIYFTVKTEIISVEFWWLEIYYSAVEGKVLIFWFWYS